MGLLVATKEKTESSVTNILLRTLIKAFILTATAAYAPAVLPPALGAAGVIAVNAGVGAVMEVATHKLEHSDN
jgi:uncharacterized MnhB-related membrane protein